MGVDFAALRKESRDRLRLSEIGLARGEGPPSQSMTVLEYVSVPLLATRTRDEAQARARIALRRLDVAECGDAHWNQLSDDERALVSLAHGLVRDPRLLLVDDPTVGLDALQQQEIVDALRSVAVEQNIGVLMTTSVLSALTGVHQAFTLSDGRLIPVTDVTRPGADVIEFPRGKQAS
jgi:ABC-type multidrug transport system ATPase subunit